MSFQLLQHIQLLPPAGLEAVVAAATKFQVQALMWRQTPLMVNPTPGVAEAVDSWLLDQEHQQVSLRRRAAVDPALL